MSLAFVALGGNIDHPIARLLAVMGEFDALPRTRLLRASSLYRTAPVGYDDQPDFINAAVLLETELSPNALMTELLAMETRHGRVRQMRNGPRTLDLDLLLYEDMILDDAELILPHPRLHMRPFVLVPLLEIGPNCIIPQYGRAASVLEQLGGKKDVHRIDLPGMDDGFQMLCRLGLGLVPIVSGERDVSLSAFQV